MATETTLPYSAIFLRQVMNGLDYALSSLRTINELDEYTRDYALNIINLGISHPDTWQQTRELLFLLAPFMEQAGWREEWIPFLEAGVEQAKVHEDLEAIGEYHYQLGILYQLNGEYERTEPHYQASAVAFGKMPDPERQGRTLNRWAYAAVTTVVKVDLAMTLLEQAEPLTVSATEKGYACMVRGAKALRENMPQITYEWFAKSWEYWETAGDVRFIAWGLSNLGSALIELQRYQEGMEILHRAVSYFELINDPAFHAIALNNLGISYYRLKNPQAALKYYQKSITVLKQLNRGRPLAMLYNAIGKAYLALEQWEQSLHAYELAIEIFNQLEDIAQIANVMSNIAEVWEAQSDFATAKQVVTEAIALLDAHPYISSYRFYRNMLLDDFTRIDQQEQSEK